MQRHLINPISELVDYNHVHSWLRVGIRSVISQVKIELPGLPVHDHLGTDKTNLWNCSRWYLFEWHCIYVIH